MCKYVPLVNVNCRVVLLQIYPQGNLTHGLQIDAFIVQIKSLLEALLVECGSYSRQES